MADHPLIEELQGLGIATVMARKGVTAVAIGAILGVDPPTIPAAAHANDLTVIGTGPESWLVVKTDAAPDFVSQLSAALAGLASVSDQSGGYVVTRLAGPRARTMLQRGAAIDFHPDSFGPGSAVTTMIAHIGVIIWQVDDQPSYHVATFRSYASSFRQWIDTTISAL